jgi:hypothetical protein
LVTDFFLRFSFIRILFVGALCRRQSLFEQADLLESYAIKISQNQFEVIDQGLNILQKLRINDDINPETIRRSQPTVPQEYGKLRRSGSFQKLRQSIRRGSEKLVQKLRGTPSNSMQYQQSDGIIKRASSMSVLNHVSPSYPLQQQQTNRTLNHTCSIDQQQQNKQQFIPPSRGRLTSAENIH